MPDTGVRVRKKSITVAQASASVKFVVSGSKFIRPMPPYAIIYRILPVFEVAIRFEVVFGTRSFVTTWHVVSVPKGIIV